MNPGRSNCCWINSGLQAWISSPVLLELIMQLQMLGADARFAEAHRQLRLVVEAIVGRCACAVGPPAWRG